MALMHDYVRRANFTTKPRLRGIFSAFALFVRGYSFKFTALGHSFMQNFATLQFKTRLGGEICSLDVNMHKGYYSVTFEWWIFIHTCLSWKRSSKFNMTFRHPLSLWVKSNFIAPTFSNLFWDSLLTRRSQNKISNVFSSDFYARCSFSTDLRLDEVPL